MSNHKAWQNFGELNNSAANKITAKDEFREELPFGDLAGDSLINAKTPRRDFLKYMGFSTAAAVAAASCEMPVHKAIPFLNKPDDITPGIANYYASTYISDGDAVPVVVKQREGRPIKIEGNELYSATRGGTSAQVQASVLDLYDTRRLRYPLIDKKEATFEAVDKAIGDGLAAASSPMVLLTSSITSVTGREIIKQFLEKYPGSRHVQYDAVSYSGMLTANQASYGQKALPSYHFEKAKVIVSLGADFLGSWLNPVVFASQYARGRKITESNPTMSRHIHFEGFLSMTGANADERYMHKPSQTGAVVKALLGALNGTAPSGMDEDLANGIRKTAADLKANNGAALVVCGSNDPNVQILVNAINEAIGANGTTIDWSSPVYFRQGIDSDMATLVNDLNAGTVGGLFIYGVNPVYSYHDKAKLVSGIKKCKLSVSYNERMDETTEICKFVIPANHWLESWGDAELSQGTVSAMQPLIHPLFKTRQFEDSLLKLIGSTDDYVTYFRNYWISKLGGENGYNKFIQDGIMEKEASESFGSLSFSGDVEGAASKIKAGGEGTEIILYQNNAVGTGSRANNAWLQEMSDPITKATWDNYAIISPEMGKSLLGIDIFNPRDADKYEVHPEKPVVKIEASGQSLELPVLIIPGTHPDVIAVAVGYGRESEDPAKTAEYIGPSAAGTGKNVYPLAGFDGVTVSYFTGCTVAKTGKKFKLALSQTHNITEGRPVVRQQSLSEFKEDPRKPHHKEDEELAQFGKDYVRDATLYPTFAKPGIKWGMSVDLSACIGCSACTIACVAENNISTVGKDEVARFHDMQWIRIDRYYTGDPKNPDVIFQPMMCQQCDNAPCENVCPVAATSHSSEGLNQMIYNRCIGTKYCMNNCPYKVRRFNWADWNGADSFPDNQRGIISAATTDLNSDLTRMVLNPDVVVRARGVMEKCTFCVQRLQEGKLNAKKENRPLRDQEVKTACMQACPTEAIQFGNVNDPESMVSKIRDKEQKDRKFYVLEHLHTLSNVNYLTKIKNTDRIIGEHNSEA
ncbi:MAG: TAT-variant-translocated molybdopterin oxidoreductase [Chitinophagaceae bacterium]|nr:TAT-variant-translocated molybdopterin oxidoreductase [Chitinophagaceae bacterium]